MKGCLKLAGYGILTLVGLGVVVAIFGGDTDQPATVRSLPTFTPTPHVQVLDAPTVVQPETPSTLVLPTVTPSEVPVIDPPVLPTATPAPPTPDPAIASYAHNAFRLMDDFASASEKLAALMQNPRIGQDDWTLQVAAGLATIRFVHEELGKLDPPPVFRPAHTALVEATALCNAATYNFAAGIDNLDVSKMNLAVEQINGCNAGIDASSEMLQEIAR